MAEIDIGAGNIPKIRMLELSAPATPASGYGYLYEGTSKDVYFKSDDGVSKKLGGYDYILVQDEKTAGTQGGTPATSAWTLRDINTEVSDTGGHCSIAANQITLAAGTYECDISAPSAFSGYHKALLYDTTGAADLLVGTSEWSSYSTTFCSNRSFIKGKFVLAVSSVLEIRHWCTNPYASSGLGFASNIDGKAEVYTVAEFRKVA